jgi:hypothetical protein
MLSQVSEGLDQQFSETDFVKFVFYPATGHWPLLTALTRT